MSTPKSFDVWRWPEFKAFAQRLGVVLDKPTTMLSILLQRCLTCRRSSASTRKADDTVRGIV